MIEREDEDDHWLRLPAPSTRVGSERRSATIVMRDGVRIAVDVHLPRGATRAPTMLRQTRYFRAVEPTTLGRALAIDGALDLYARTRKVFLAAGWAWVDADVRGTGASGGAWLTPWSPDEVRDGAGVVDWIVAQPWSDGSVGSLGISYDGTSAEMLTANQHPAVRAVAPLFALHDVFTDVAFPGGIALSWFTERWAEYNGALDRDSLPDAVALSLYLIGRAGAASPSPRGLERVLAPLVRGEETAARRRLARFIGGLVRGVRPADGAAPDRAARARNMNVHAASGRVDFRDQPGASPALPEATADLFSPHAHADRIAGSGAAIYSYSGWRDGAYPHGAIKRFHRVQTPGSRLTLGPWVHSGRLRIRPFGVAAATRFDHDAELLAFFDESVRGLPPRGDGKAVHYYTAVEGRWKSSALWPPEGFAHRPLHLAAGRSLTANPPSENGADELTERGANGTGERSRWRSLVSLVPGDYPDRRERDRGLLCYDGPPLDEDLEVTGHPIAVLHVAFDAPDGHLFAYLEDVAPDGSVAYVTEGQLRALHRRIAKINPRTGVPERTFLRTDGAPLVPGERVEITLDLLPISWLFRRRHRIRLALAAADADHFAPLPHPLAPRTLMISRGSAHPSRIELPVKKGA